ncbi:MAG: TonB-dependent receptor plug domain-containing protein [Pseudohongiellaceae bacterium]
MINRQYKGRITRLGALVLAISLCGNAAAQTDTSSALESTTVTYPASYFTEFAPVSVNDMLNVIPGMNMMMGGGPGGGGGGGNNRRGLGAGENEILINGQRMTGKNTSARDQLSRISASQVDYIEIIRGSSEALDVRNSGQTLNIVLVDSLSRRSINTEVNVDYINDGTVDPGGKFSVSGQTSALNYLFSADVEPRYNNEIRREVSYLPDYSLNDVTYEEDIRDETDYGFSGALSYQFDRDLVQFNALYGFSNPPSETYREITNFTGSAPVLVREREARDFERYNWETGGDWDHTFDNGSKYRLLFVVNDRQGEGVRERFNITDNGDDKNLYLYNMGRDRERILRSSYTFSPAAGHGLEVGVERAQTIRNSDLRMGLAISGTPSNTVGGLVPVSIDNSTSEVEEIRYETFAMHNWQINDRMSLESILLLESSKINQTGDVSKSRDFDFVRPKMEYRFDITSSLQLRLGVEKEVSQLSFSDFSASVDNSDLDKETEAGNPEIVQEQAWVYNLNMEYRLPNDNGVFNAGVYYRDISDVIDRIDISTATSLLSTRGNIGDAKRYGINMNLSSRLGFVGLPNAMLTAGLSLGDSEVTDPFLGIERRMRGNGRGFSNWGFRHDLPQMNANYGFNVGFPMNGGSGRTFIDIDDIEVESNEPQMTFYAEKKAFGGTTFRLEARNILDSQWCRERTRFDGATVNGIIEEIEDSCNSNGPRLALKVRKTF